MNKKLFYLYLICAFVLIISFLYAKSVWVAKINNSEEITLQDFNDSYKATILMSSLGSPLPISKSQINKIFFNKKERLKFLKQYVDQSLILNKAKEKHLYKEDLINKEAKSILKVLKRQLILKRFLDNYIFPKVKLSNREIENAYRQEKNKKNSRIRTLSEKQAKQVIKNNLKAQKGIRKLQEYTERLRLESRIIVNENKL